MHRPLLVQVKIILLWLILLPIVVGTYLIVWFDRWAKLTFSFPRNVDELSRKQDWCIRELKKNKVLPANAVIQSYKVTPLNQTIIFRSNAGIVEIEYSSGGTQQQLKCFAKFAPLMGSVWNKTIFNIQLNHIKEADFNRWFVKDDAAIPAPKVYCSQVSPYTGHLCLLTEYMDGCKEYMETVYETLPQEHLEAALEGMAALHARCWGEKSERMKKVLPIEHNTVLLMDSIVQYSWSVPARKVLDKSWSLMNECETVIHGDSRIGNMMFPSETGKGRFVLIDWQAVRKGKAVYDVAYFLMLSLHSGHLRAVEEQSLNHYYSYLTAKGVTEYSRLQLEEDYRHACLCVLVLLSLPLLSGEVSVEGDAAKIFVWGMEVWRKRMEDKFSTFDYVWMAQQYNLTEQEAKDAVAEMLQVIKKRLDGIYSGNLEAVGNEVKTITRKA